ncbi:hypothetical protein [Novipirellula caenicola]|uniref:Uncharacterized protein n=1 Tax=Novipirellula caenicola TaxID=1536901 RepID=A0ABP9VIK8_9BACT
MDRTGFIWFATLHVYHHLGRKFKMAKTKSSASVAVVDYDVSWDTKKNRGGIRVKLQQGKPLVIRNIENVAEYIAILTLLQGEKTVFATRSGVLTTAP